jgi:hemerythrin
MITWDKSMSTGVQAFDEQHKMLFSKFNDFSRAISKMINGEKELETWLVSHIIRADTQFRPCIKN